MPRRTSEEESALLDVRVDCGTPSAGAASSLRDEESASSSMTVKAKVRERTVALRVQSGSTVGALKKRILADAKEEGKWLRLIHSGRMLADDDATLAPCKVAGGAHVHCAPAWNF